MEKKQKELVLIDAYGFLFRAYYSLPPMQRADGLPVGGIYGFSNMLLKLLEKERLDNKYIAIILDSGRKTFRSEIYADYKANRPEAPDDLKPQFSYLSKVANSFGIKSIEAVGFEADDIIATLAQQAAAQDFQVKIVSSDKDLMQLINSNVYLYDSLKEKDIREPEVLEKFAVAPNKVLELLSLMGDASDNIPGVKGVGPKTATQLINQFGSLENLYQNLGSVENKRIKELLEVNKDNAFLSKKLAALHYEVPLPVKLEELKVDNINWEGMLGFFQEMGFKSLFNRIAQKHGVANNVVSTKNKIALTFIEDAVKLKVKINQIKDSDACYLLIDKNNHAYFFNDKQGVEFLVGEKQQSQANLFEESKENFLELIENILTDNSYFLTTYNQAEIARKFKISCGSSADDLKLILYLLNGASKDLPYELEFLSKDKFSSEDLENFIVFSNQLKQELLKKQLTPIYLELDRPFTKILNQMERNGIGLDLIYLENLKDYFTKKIDAISKTIYSKAGKEFNIASNKQLGEVLYEDLKIATTTNNKKSKSGNYITDSDVLEELSLAGNSIADDILEFREISKLKNTYVDGLIPLVNPKTNKIHSSFEATSTLTGRLSSHNPNLQNIPIKTLEGRKIRKAFISQKNKIFISADYSQIELRILAHIAKIPSLIQAFKEKKDIHKITATQVFGVKENQVDDDLRRKAKTINFGIIYGQTAYGLSKQLGISVGEAKNYIDKYFLEYPGIKEYMEKTINQARKNGFVETLWGRKCYIKNINSKEGVLRNFSERSAINAPIQGTASDFVKKAMIAIDFEFKKTHQKANLVLQIHDELIFEVEENASELLAKTIKNKMERVAFLDVPLEVNISFGKDLEAV
jgi:DNA polymerase-1